MSIEGLIKRKRGVFVSPVRCIKKLYPIKDAPAFALVLSAGKKEDHEKRMEALKLLSDYNAVCSFAVTGESASDEEFVQKAIAEGFELINGGYSGRPFSDRKNVSRDILPLHSWSNIYADTQKLHDTVNDRYGYKITAGMPPFGVEYIEGALSAYDLYDYFGYQLIKGSLAIAPGEEKLLGDEIAQNKDALNGQVVVAGLESAPALVAQFAKLGNAGYGVCSVKDLMEVSPFSDIGPDDPVFEPAKRLLDNGHPVVNRNNKVNPRPYEIIGDTLMTFSSRETRAQKVDRILDGKTMLGKYSVFNPYCAVIAWARLKMGRVKFDFPTTSALFTRCLLLNEVRADIGRRRYQYRRAEVIKMYADILCATEEQDPYGVFEYHMSDIEYELRKEIGDEAFEEIKKEVDEKKAAEAAKTGEKKSEDGTILDRFNRKQKDSDKLETIEDSEHKDVDVNKDQIIL
ncbi:MAG: hypothetical protein MJ194_00310 [Clostridia bacterium]|nr:hypothetical protein [Clostridia bacterium]